ncbi:hypothetical protein D3C72_878310 [compost metagenome]
MRPSSALPAASRAAPLRMKLSRRRSARRVCWAFRPLVSAPSATALMRWNSFSLKVISSPAADRIGDSSVSRTSHCSPPMFEVMTLNTFRARSSGSPTSSMATRVLAKVGASGLSAIAATSARCSSMPSRMASRILGAVTLSQGGTPS